MRKLSTVFGRASATTRALVIVAAVAAIGLFAFIPVIATPRTAPREIVLVARDMTFYLEGSETPNPTLVLKLGEEVRVVVRNQEPGVTHRFAIASLHALIEPIPSGTSGSLWLRAPDQPGQHEYFCRPHAQMMRGVLLVEE